MLVTDGNGVPLGLKIASAQRAEISLAEHTLETVKVPRPGGRGRPKCRPREVVADRAYDSWVLRANLRSRGIRPCIPERKGKRPKPGPRPRLDSYRLRWHVERTFAWFGNYRRFLVRHEYYPHVFEGFVLLICILICANRLLQ